MKTLSIIICTYNRCESLKDTLRAVSLQTVPEDCTLETIVVDNNSKDQTRAVVESMKSLFRWPLIYVFEGQQGLSAARNKGLAQASGSLILFTDDDVMPEANWVFETLRGFTELKVDALGGKILPVWEVPAPEWMQKGHQREQIWGMYALLDEGNEPVVAHSAEGGLFYGANMAFKREVFDQLGNFRTDLGVIGNKRRLDDDTEMLQRLYAAGKLIGYWPSSVVHHKVPKERMTISYIRNWRYNKALSSVRTSGEIKPLSLWLLKECVLNGVCGLVKKICGKSTEEIHYKMQFWTQLGQIKGSLEKMVTRGKDSH